jgi:hypothetical protein
MPMNDSLYFDSPHQLYFDMRGPVPIKDIAESLLALEKVLFKTEAVFQALAPDADIKELRVLLTSVESGSLKDNFITRFVFGSEEGRDRFADHLRVITGVEAMQNKNEFIGQVITLCLVAGLGYAVIRGVKGGGTTIHIEQVERSVLNIGDGALTISPDELKALVDENLKNTHQLATNAAKVVKTAKRDDSARLVLDDHEQLVITPEAIAETPAKVPRANKVERFETANNIDVIIRATDRDDPDKGWWVVLPAIYPDRRIKAEIHPSIDINWLGLQSRVQANVRIRHLIDAKGNETLKDLMILKASNSN